MELIKFSFLIDEEKQFQQVSGRQLQGEEVKRWRGEEVKRWGSEEVRKWGSEEVRRWARRWNEDDLGTYDIASNIRNEDNLVNYDITSNVKDNSKGGQSSVGNLSWFSRSKC